MTSHSTFPSDQSHPTPPSTTSDNGHPPPNPLSSSSYPPSGPSTSLESSAMPPSASSSGPSHPTPSAGPSSVGVRHSQRARKPTVLSLPDAPSPRAASHRQSTRRPSAVAAPAPVAGGPPSASEGDAGRQLGAFGIAESSGTLTDYIPPRPLSPKETELVNHLGRLQFVSGLVRLLPEAKARFVAQGGKPAVWPDLSVYVSRWLISPKLIVICDSCPCTLVPRDRSVQLAGWATCPLRAPRGRAPSDHPNRLAHV